FLGDPEHEQLDRGQVLYRVEFEGFFVDEVSGIHGSGLLSVFPVDLRALNHPRHRVCRMVMLAAGAGSRFVKLYSEFLPFTPLAQSLAQDRRGLHGTEVSTQDGNAEVADCEAGRGRQNERQLRHGALQSMPFRWRTTFKHRQLPLAGHDVVSQDTNLAGLVRTLK